MNRVDEEKWLKEAYLETLGYAVEAGAQVFTFKQIQALRNMAEKDVYPDGRFSDMECTIWEMFHNFHIKTGD